MSNKEVWGRGPLVCGLLLVGCLLTFNLGVPAQEESTTDGSVPHLLVETKRFERTLERSGTLVPGQFEPIILIPEAYAKGFTVERVLPHGTPVNEGDIIVRFDPGPLTEQIQRAKMDAESASIRHRNGMEQAEVDQVMEAASREEAENQLLGAKKDLEGWEKYELDFSQRQRVLSDQAYKNMIDDQKDELSQLEAMYRDDELVDATEELVLKRSRRSLAQAHANQRLRLDRQRYSVEYGESEATKAKRRTVLSRELALRKVERSQRLTARSRKDSLARAEDSYKKAQEQVEKLEKDRALLTVHASRSGVLYHGDPQDYRPGKVAPRYKKWSSVPLRKILFTVGDPSQLQVAFDIQESEIAALRPQLAVRVSPVSAPTASILGTLSYETFPSPDSSQGAENKYQAWATLTKSTVGYLPGMRVKAEVVVEEFENAVVLPRNAIFGGGEESHCFLLLTTGECKRVNVKVCGSKDNEVRVEGPITAGQKVLLCKPQ